MQQQLLLMSPYNYGPKQTIKKGARQNAFKQQQQYSV